MMIYNETDLSGIQFSPFHEYQQYTYKETYNGRDYERENRS